MKRASDLGLDWRSLERAILVLLPVVTMALVEHESGWLQLSVMTMSRFIAHERSGTSPVGVLIHTIAIAAASSALLVSQGYAALFVLLCAVSPWQPRD